MLQIDENLRMIYKNDSLPIAKSISHKVLTLYFEELGLTIENELIDGESFKLTESLCSENTIKFGSCESAVLNITIADVKQDLKNQTVIVTQTVDGTYTMPLGTYKVDSAKKRSDSRFRDIIAYDQMKKFDVDVTSWFNSLSFPMTIKEFRISLCKYIGIPVFEQELINDNAIVRKTIIPTVISGREVLMKIAEINGAFGHITRDNLLKFMHLGQYGLYPSETLYPAENLYPSESNEFIGDAGYRDCNYDDYVVKPITKLQIREQQGDIGVTVGSGESGYIIQDNFITFGMTSDELASVANNVLKVIEGRYYTPQTTIMAGLPYVEVGDSITIVTTNDAIETFVLNRELSGLQILTDTIHADGSEYQEQDFGMDTNIQQLKSQSMKIKADVDGLDIQINGEDGVTSQIQANADSIYLEILRAQDAERSLSSSISITDSRVSTKVSKGNVSSEISVEHDQVILSSNRLVVDSTNFKLDEDGNATFSGDVVGATITGGTITQTVDDFVTVEIDEKGVYVQGDAEIHVGQYSTGYTVISDEGVSVTGQNGAGASITKNGYFGKVNGATAITTNNVSGYVPSDTEDLAAYTRASTTAGGELVSFSNTSGNTDVACASFVQAYVGSTSDERLKENIKEIEDINVDQYMRLQPIEWDWKLNGGHDIGLGAHALYEIYPDMIRKNDDVSDDEKALCPDGVWEIKYKCLHAEHIKMIQRHEILIDSLVTRVEKLERGGIRRWIKRMIESIGKTNRQQQQR